VDGHTTLRSWVPGNRGTGNPRESGTEWAEIRGHEFRSPTFLAPLNRSRRREPLAPPGSIRKVPLPSGRCEKSDLERGAISASKKTGPGCLRRLLGFGIHFGSDEMYAKLVFSHLPDRETFKTSQDFCHEWYPR
jgi:hypothetical protein